MSTAARVEPTVSLGPVPASTSTADLASSARPETDFALGEQLVIRPTEMSGRRSAEGASSEQLARVEEKVARIEDKLARFEANNQRVVDRFELASARMSEVAQQGELAAVRTDAALIARRVRNLPGLTALVACAIVTAVLTAALTALVLRYLPGFLPR